MTLRTIPDSAALVVSDEALSSDFGEELVILDLRDGVYYGLEDAGARIWNLLRARTTVAAIRDALLAEYDVDDARCERDVRAIIAELADRGLIRIIEEA